MQGTRNPVAKPIPVKTYGKVEFITKDRTWVVTAEPHVVLRLKRVFAQLGKKSQGKHIFSDTPEWSRDMIWFMDRYPLEIKPLERSYMESQARRHKDRVTLVEQLVSGLIKPRAFEMAIPARDYQRVAAETVLSTGGLLLADQLGTGKTISAIAMLTDPRTRPALVVTLTHLPKQWADELQRFAPSLKTHIVKSTTPYDLTSIKNTNGNGNGKQPRLPGTMPDVIIMNYHKLHGWAETLRGVVKSCTFDECLTKDMSISQWPPGALSRKITECQPGDDITAFDEHGAIVPDIITSVTYKGMREVWRFTLEDGRYLDCSTNERIMTEAGMAYASEILYAACTSNATHETDRAYWNRASGDPWLVAGGCWSRQCSKPSAPAYESRRDTGRIRKLQSPNPSQLRSDTAPDCREQGLRQTVVRIHNGHDPRLRFFAEPMPDSHSERKMAEDGHGCVACGLDLGRCGILVYGRRPFNNQVAFCRHQHSFVQSAGSGDAQPVVPRSGNSSSHGSGVDTSRQGCIHLKVQKSTDGSVYRADQAFHPTVHGVQDANSTAGNGSVCNLRHDCSQEESKGRHAIHMREARLLALQIPSVDINAARIRISTSASDLLQMPERYSSSQSRSLPEVPQGARQCAKRGEVSEESSQDDADLLLVREDVSESGWADPAKTMLPSARMLEAVSPMVQTLVSRRLVSVERLGFREVYDLETEKHHTLFANGFAVHNCQELRTGEGTGKYSAARLIAQGADFRLGMSGSPIYGYGGEFYNVLDCIKPGALGTRAEFIEEWCTGGNNGKPALKEPKAFGSYLKDNGYMLLRTRAEVGREIPPLTKIPHFIDADLNALNTVSRSCAELARLILKQGEARKGEKMMASDEFSLKLRQATGLAKAPFTADFVRLLIEQGEPVILGAWHRAVYDVFLDKLKDFEPAMFTGSESPTQKENSKQRFIKGKTPLFIISNRSGVGLDGLQNVCSTVVHGELDYSNGPMDQLDGRVYRDGQPNPVTAYYLIAEVGSDPVISDILGIKTHQLSGVLHPEQELVEKLQVDTKDRMKRLAESYLAQLAKRG